MTMTALALVSLVTAYIFEVTLVHSNGHLQTYSTSDTNSHIQVIDNIPHISLNTSEYTFRNYTARLPLAGVPAKIFNPHGFGALINCARGSCQFENEFPAMQFTFASYGNVSAYFGAHDVHATIKTIAGSREELRISGPLEMRRVPNNRLYPVLDFPIVAEEVRGDYYDAAMRYRSFVFAELPDWVSTRLEETPLDKVQLWVNTHWQEYDVFAKSGGKPESVLFRVQQLLDLLKDELSPDELALHWYEWDGLGFPVEEGYEGVCDNSVRCGFDSHYPQYFPARRNFESVVEELAEIGVKIFPYINGRIFDTNIPSWDAKSKRAAAKNVDGNIYTENYGNGVDFAAMCPATKFWQQSMSSVVDQILDVPVAGVYVDQVACANSVPCYDENHDHPPGGGSFWTAGYRQMMTKLRNNHPTRFFVTESNVEQFIGSFDGFLALQAFWDDTSETEIVPVFQAIYGGYMRTFGSIFHAIDLESAAFREKLALQFVFGAQLGWFGLVGSDKNAGYPTVGLLEGLLDPKNKVSVDFMKKLISERRKIAHIFTTGRAGRRLGRFALTWLVDNQAYLISVNPYAQVVDTDGVVVPPLDVVVQFVAKDEKHTATSTLVL